MQPILITATDKGLRIESEYTRNLVKEMVRKGTTQFELVPVKKDGTRSLSQNRALHMMYKWAADEVNATGLTLRDLIVDVDVPVTEKSIKELWRAIQLEITGKESTTQLNKSEVDQVFEVFTRNLADKGVNITFPSAEKRSEFFAALDIAEKMDYPVWEGDVNFD